MTRKNEEAARKKPTLDTTSLSLVLQYNDLHPTHQLQLTNSDHSFLYVYQWMSSNPEVATVSDKGLVTAQAAGTTTITAMVSNGQALRCSVTVTSDIGKVTLNKSDLLLRTVGTQERHRCGGGRRQRAHYMGQQQPRCRYRGCGWRGDRHCRWRSQGHGSFARRTL